MADTTASSRSVRKRGATRRRQSRTAPSALTSASMATRYLAPAHRHLSALTLCVSLVVWSSVPPPMMAASERTSSMATNPPL